MDKKQIAHFPGPTTLGDVTLGAASASIGYVARIRATVWDDGDATVRIETGAAGMQLNASYEELSALRDMIDATMAAMPSPEPVLHVVGVAA